MSRMRKIRIALVAVFAATAVVLAGCTSAGSGGGDGGHKEAVFISAIQEDPVGLNAEIVNSPGTLEISAPMLEPIIGLSATYKLFPLLAKKWEFSKDGLELTLHLEKGVTWHDGEPFTSADVKFNFDEIMKFQTYGPAMLAHIASVEAPDTDTVVVKLKTPYGPILETLALQLMLPKHLYEGTDVATNPYNLKPVGTGPMMFKSYTSGQEVVLVKNPHYWGGKVKVDRVVYPIMSDPNARTLSLLSGDVDQAAVDPSQQKQVASHPELVHLKASNFPQAVVLEMNAKNKYLSNKDVRAAVFSAIDRKAIAKVALSGQAEVAQGFFPDSLKWAVDKKVNFDKDFPFDVKAINSKLDELGYAKGANGLRFTLNVKYISVLTDTAAAAEQVKSMLADVGIGLNLVGVASANFTDSVYTKGDFDLAFLRSTVSADPSLGISRWYQCNPDKMAARNPSGICDPQIDAAAAGAASTSDRTQRGKFFSQMQQQARDLMFFAPLVWTNASFPTVNTSRWTLLDNPGEDVQSGGHNWLEMTPKK